MPNDHSDAVYDAGVVARLVELDRNAQGVCVAFTDQLTRVRSRTRRGSRTALEKVKAGDQK